MSRPGDRLVTDNGIFHFSSQGGPIVQLGGGLNSMIKTEKPDELTEANKKRFIQAHFPNDDIDEPMSNLDNFKAYRDQFRHTILATSGCGKRGDIYLDEAYEKMQKSYNELTEEEQKQVDLPRKVKCSDDGTGGIRTGLGFF